MSKLVLSFTVSTSLAVLLLLTGCGNGSDSNANPNVGGVGYGPGRFGQNGKVCNEQVQQDWNNMLAPACAQNNGSCSQAAQMFLQRNQSYLQSSGGCSLPVANGQWFPTAATSVNSQYQQLTVATVEALANQGNVGYGYPNQPY